MNRNALILIVFLFVAGVLGYNFLGTNPEVQNGKVTLSEAIALPVNVDDKSVLVTLKLYNQGPPQKIISISSLDAQHGMFHGAKGKNGLVIPSNSGVSFAMDGAHIMLHGIEGELVDGRLITLKLELEPAGTFTTKARFSAKQMSGYGGHQTKAGDDQPKPTMNHGGHYAVPEGEPKPTISLDTKAIQETSGWDVAIDVSDFIFDRESVDGAHVPGKGHGHLYINGLKIGRVFEPVIRIGQLPKGTHKINVTLNTNDHKMYMVSRKPVSATVDVLVD